MRRFMKSICAVMALAVGLMPCADACTSFQIKGEDGLKALEVAIAAYESAKSKSPVKI